jgi:dTMP kinase
MIIAIEGPDGVGKTTQCELLSSKLAEIYGTSRSIRFPCSSSATGRVIRQVLSSEASMSKDALQLLFAANRCEKRNDILSASEEGTPVILDRYSHSGIAYGVANGLDMEWCRALEETVPQPDIVVYIDVPEDEAERRIAARGEREIYDTREFQARVREAYRILADLNSHSKWISVSGSGPPEDVCDRIMLSLRAEMSTESSFSASASVRNDA